MRSNEFEDALAYSMSNLGMAQPTVQERLQASKRTDARQRLACLLDGCDGVSACCGTSGHEFHWNEPPFYLTAFCDWDGCPSEDCVSHGPCQCVCHREDA